MKCPKCGYLGFEQVDRCRNCGYDFSLLPEGVLPELSIREADDDPISPIDDLVLTVSRSTVPSRRTLTEFEVAPTSATTPAAELPLFSASSRDDAPLITRPSPPRPPLAVRRSTPEVPRLRSDAPRAPLLDLSAPPLASERTSAPVKLPVDTDRWTERRADEPQPAGLLARVGAVTVDLAILALIDAIVVYFTMQICGLSWSDLHILPKGPLIAFLVVQNGGYLVAFNAGGQTLGKMAAGIRVVSASGSASVDVGHAVVRTAIWIVLAVPAGLGFATALFSRDRRGLHDQFAGTRVVRSTPLA